MTTVEDFHLSRRMFCILEGKVIVGPERSPMSHREWFQSMGLDADEAVRDAIRGFADGRGVFFYRGEDFRVDDETERLFRLCLPAIAEAMGLRGDTQVFGGIRKTDTIRWPPKKAYGAVDRLLSPH